VSFGSEKRRKNPKERKNHPKFLPKEFGWLFLNRPYAGMYFEWQIVQFAL
jgi:hypothetical protein